MSYLETGQDYFKYPAAFALLMIPLSKLHRHISVPIWYLSIFIFFMAAIFLMQKILISGAQKALSKLFYWLAIMMSLRFLLSTVQRVQSDALVLIFLSLFISALFYKKEFWAGLALASAAMVKLTPLIFLPYLLLRKKLKAAFSFCMFCAFYLLLPSFYVGWGKNAEYLKNFLLVHQTNPSDYLIWYKNQSLLSFLLRLLSKDSSINLLNLPPYQVTLIFAGLAAILFFAVFIVRARSQDNQSEFCYLAEISLVLICMILFSPLAWKHTFIHLLIPHMVLLYYLFYINPAERATKALVIASFLLNTVLNPELTKPFAKLIQLYSSVTLGTLILYIALLRLRLLACRR